MDKVRTRMAPSPTGNLHIGTAYATMWPYVFARHNDGIFILRFEDTDKDRSTKEFEENIEKGLSWLGFEWDEGPFHQMDRLETYQKHAQKLLDENKAYLCFCTKEELDAERKRQSANHEPLVYSGKCRDLSKEEVDKNIKEGKDYAIRFKVPDNRGVVEFEDLIHGKVAIDSKLIGDTLIMRPGGVPLYNFAVVVDDIDMKVTHIIRGDDHISNTPKQILIYEAFDYPVPKIAHSPMILNEDRIGKLSKRTGSTSVESFKEEGYLPEALFNYIALLGWTPKDGQEIFSKEELVSKFDLKDMNSSGAAWNQDKLDWINGEYIRKLSDDELTKRLQDYLKDYSDKEKIAKLSPLVKERMKKLSDFIAMCDWIFEKSEYDLKPFEDLKVPNTKLVLEQIKEQFNLLERPWKITDFEESFKKLALDLELTNFQIFQLIRLMVSGQLVTPPLFESIEILGEEEALKRIEYVVKTYPDFPKYTGD